MRLKQLAWCALAYLCIGLGIAGIILPLVPTTPFLLLALWAATNGSPRLANWLYYHPRFGPYLHAWQEQRAIPKRAKIIALLLLATSWVTLWASGGHPLLLAGMAVFFCGVATFILTRPTARNSVHEM
ncbi:MAG: hypothetical protein HLUCCA13_07240 [Halomonas sp. HL-48]|nr:YbaN family protein [Halomonas sp. HL-48]KPQ24874.1 MAG: hypothetical protein HLUCCA13_07240 [Halomonas sp. HL-48]